LAVAKAAEPVGTVMTGASHVDSTIQVQTSPFFYNNPGGAPILTPAAAVVTELRSLIVRVA